MNRKKSHFIVLLPILIFFFAFGIIGCKTAWLSINLNDAQTVAVKAAARPFGSQFAKKNPDIVLPATLLCESYTTGELSQDSIDRTAKYLSQRFEQDPAMSKSVVELLGLLKPTPDAKWNVALVKAAAEGFLDGMAMATEADSEGDK